MGGLQYVGALQCEPEHIMQEELGHNYLKFDQSLDSILVRTASVDGVPLRLRPS